MKKALQILAVTSLFVAPTAAYANGRYGGASWGGPSSIPDPWWLCGSNPVFQRLSDEGNWPYHC